MRRIATSLCAAGMLLGLVGPASAGAFGPTGSFDGSGSGSGQFSHPEGAVVTGSTVYVADTANSRVPFYSATGAFQGDLGGSPASPQDVAVAPDGAVIAAGSSQVVRWVLGVPLVSWGPPGASYGVAVDGSGTIYVSDAQAGVIRKYNGLGQPQGSIGSPGSGPGQLAQPQGLTSDGASVYVADPGNGRILKFDAAGNVQGQWAMPTYTIVANGTTITGRIEP